MPLVDYSESDGSASEANSPPTKRRKACSIETHGVDDADGAATDNSGSDPGSGSGQKKVAAGPNPGVSASASTSTAVLPPLPDEFHDLYASTVRTSTVDDPTLHQGRKRTIPHIAGNWPSHVYIEWHATASQHALLTELLDKIEPVLGPEKKLHPLLTSDLNAPLPLHISLSRPLSLTTAQKDDFLSALTSSVSTAAGPFTLSPRGIGFFKSPDSDRAFLVLRVATSPVRDKIKKSTSTSTSTGNGNGNGSGNPQLRALLARCNAVAARFHHPPLYQAHPTQLVDDAFHVSIAWTFGLPAEDACLQTYGMLRAPGEFRQIRGWEIAVSGVKAKIGNAVTHIPLRGGRDGREGGEVDGLFA